MKNRDFIRRVIHCAGCIHRHTKICPMYVEVVIDYQTKDIKIIDNTYDDMYCSEGENERYYPL